MKIHPLEVLNAHVAKLQKVREQQQHSAPKEPVLMSYSECILRAGMPVFLKYRGDRRDN
jgi:hypothetical protein